MCLWRLGSAPLPRIPLGPGSSRIYASMIGGTFHICPEKNQIVVVREFERNTLHVNGPLLTPGDWGKALARTALKFTHRPLHYLIKIERG